MRPIDADKLVKEIGHICPEFGNEYASFVDHEEVLDIIKEQPTMNVAPCLQAEWIEWYPPKEFIFTGDEMLFVCSNCTAKYEETTRYCPFCGALMEGVRQNKEI